MQRCRSNWVCRWTIALLAFGAMGIPASAQLLNPSFEEHAAGLDSWVTFNDVIPNVLSETTTPLRGDWVAKVFGGFNGNPNYSGMFQGVTAAAGQTWRASCYVRHNAGDSLAGTTNSMVMKIEFYRVFGAPYGGADFLGEHTITILDAEAPTDRWLFRTFQAQAPTETIEARIAFVFTQPGNEGGAAWLDMVGFQTVASGGDAAWEVVWSDEFDGSVVDSAKWHVEDLHTIKNNELQYYAPDEVYLDGGNLVLRSRQRSYWGYDNYGNWRHFDYTSGLVSTWDRLAPVNGRIEIRAKLPGTKGMWPAHWMLSQYGGWPPEIDIMELVGDIPSRVTMSLHWGPLGPNGEPPWEIGQTANTDYWGPDYTQDFHTYTLEWWPGLLMWYIDDTLRFSTTRPQIPTEPMYLILNTAVGGDWPGSPDGTTVWPQYHLFDYVRFSVPSDPGVAWRERADASATAGTTDGTLTTGEYAAQFAGINSGFGDIIGPGSALHVDTTSTGELTLALESATALDTAGTGGVVIYVDSVAGGLVSNVDFGDWGNIYRRLVSGLTTSGQRADLFFAPGFRADHAICLGPDSARVYEFDGTWLHLINGAALGAATDLFGGTDVRYVVDDGSLGGRLRELVIPLDDISVAPLGRFRMLATLLDGESAYRANEFIGVGPGNDWDGANPGQSHVTLKQGDFIEFTAAPQPGDLDADGVVTPADGMLAAGCLTGPCSPAACIPPLHADDRCGFADFELDGDADLADIAVLMTAID